MTRADGDVYCPALDCDLVEGGEVQAVGFDHIMSRLLKGFSKTVTFTKTSKAPF